MFSRTLEHLEQIKCTGDWIKKKKYGLIHVLPSHVFFQLMRQQPWVPDGIKNRQEKDNIKRKIRTDILPKSTLTIRQME